MTGGKVFDYQIREIFGEAIASPEAVGNMRCTINEEPPPTSCIMIFLLASKPPFAIAKAAL
jgi:hypothetical protein